MKIKGVPMEQEMDHEDEKPGMGGMGAMEHMKAMCEACEKMGVDPVSFVKKNVAKAEKPNQKEVSSLKELRAVAAGKSKEGAK